MEIGREGEAQKKQELMTRWRLLHRTVKQWRNHKSYSSGAAESQSHRNQQGYQKKKTEYH